MALPSLLLEVNSVRPRHDDQTDNDGEDGDVLNAELAAEQLQGAGDDGGVALGSSAPDQQGGVLQQVADADGGDEDRQGGGGAQGLVSQTLNDDAQDRTDSHGQQNGNHRRQTQIGSGAEGDVAAHHDDVAVGEVQHLGDAVDHGVAQGDDGVDAAQADAADEVGQKFHDWVTPLFTLKFKIRLFCGRNRGIAPGCCRCFYHSKKDADTAGEGTGPLRRPKSGYPGRMFSWAGCRRRP